MTQRQIPIPDIEFAVGCGGADGDIGSIREDRNT
jgi:hypothetical protein